MKILLLDPDLFLEHSLRAQGHELKVLHHNGGIFHLPELLGEDGFSPELLVQQERLGPRNYFTGLSGLSCPTLFWSLDTHLNMFWHQWYALLFDGVLTPHVSLFQALPASLRPKETYRFSWPGSLRSWKPHAGRTHAMGLCARVTEHRQIRAWMTALLENRGLAVAEGLSPEEMMRLYDDSRVVPNECIANEVNFRLLEGASSGCLVLSPDVGEDQNSLLEPGREFLLYHDGLELVELTAWARAKPAAAEVIGRAAANRVRKEHLPEHRARFVVERGKGLTRNRLTGSAADLAFWIIVALQYRNGTLTLSPLAHAEKGLALVQGELARKRDHIPDALVAQALTQVLCLFAEGQASSAAPERALLLCRDLLARWQAPPCNTGDSQSHAPLGTVSLEPAAAASAFCLSRGDIVLARAFYALYSGKEGKDGLPMRPGELCAAWAAAFRKQGTLSLSGFRFVPERNMLPESALAWFLFARHLEPESFPGLLGRLESLLEDAPAYLSLYIGFLAEHCLVAQREWRPQLDYGLACIRGCRVEAGLFELGEAWVKAKQAGQERLFQARLRARSPVQRDWGRILAERPEKTNPAL